MLAEENMVNDEWRNTSTIPPGYPSKNAPLVRCFSAQNPVSIHLPVLVRFPLQFALYPPAQSPQQKCIQASRHAETSRLHLTRCVPQNFLGLQGSSEVNRNAGTSQITEPDSGDRLRPRAPTPRSGVGACGRCAAKPLREAQRRAEPGGLGGGAPQKFFFNNRVFFPVSRCIFGCLAGCI